MESGYPDVPRLPFISASLINTAVRYNVCVNSPTLKIIEDIADIPAKEWNALAGGDPFLSHAYLYALQASDGSFKSWFEMQSHYGVAYC